MAHQDSLNLLTGTFFYNQITYCIIDVIDIHRCTVYYLYILEWVWILVYIPFLHCVKWAPPGLRYTHFSSLNVAGTRYWPKKMCDEDGLNCLLGSSGGPGEGCSTLVLNTSSWPERHVGLFSIEPASQWALV